MNMNEMTRSKISILLLLDRMNQSVSTEVKVLLPPSVSPTPVQSFYLLPFLGIMSCPSSWPAWEVCVEVFVKRLHLPSSPSFLDGRDPGLLPLVWRSEWSGWQREFTKLVCSEGPQTECNKTGKSTCLGQSALNGPSPE